MNYGIRREKKTFGFHICAISMNPASNDRWPCVVKVLEPISNMENVSNVPRKN